MNHSCKGCILNASNKKESYYYIATTYYYITVQQEKKLRQKQLLTIELIIWYEQSCEVALCYILLYNITWWLDM